MVRTLAVILLAMSLHAFEGVLIPFYHYPFYIDKEVDRLIALKKRYPHTKMIVIINPNNGTFSKKEHNFAFMIERLKDSGIITIGYIHTDYGKRPIEQVRTDITHWAKLYKTSGIRGIFIDEVNCSKSSYYENLAKEIRKNFDLVVANPGYACDEGACWSDVVVIHERGDRNVTTKSMPIKRAVLIHSANSVDLKGIEAEYIYITDQKLPNPWGKLSRFLPELLDRIEARFQKDLNKKAVQLQTQSHE